MSPKDWRLDARTMRGHLLAKIRKQTVKVLSDAFDGSRHESMPAGREMSDFSVKIDAEPIDVLRLFLYSVGSRVRYSSRRASCVDGRAAADYGGMGLAVMAVEPGSGSASGNIVAAAPSYRSLLCTPPFCRPTIVEPTAARLSAVDRLQTDHRRDTEQSLGGSHATPFVRTTFTCEPT